MFKLFAAVLICAVCMSPAVEGAVAAVVANASPVQTLNPALIDFYGYQIGYPLLAPNNGEMTSLLAASMPPRTYIGQSNPVLIRTPCSDQFVGESSLGILAI